MKKEKFFDKRRNPPQARTRGHTHVKKHLFNHFDVRQLFVSPIALTAAIFSMSNMKEVIPFLPANFVSFVCLILIFGIMGIAILALHPYQFGWQVVLILARHIRQSTKVADVEKNAVGSPDRDNG